MKITKIATLPQSLVVGEEGEYRVLCVEEGDRRTFLIEHTDTGKRIDHWHFSGAGNYERYCEMAHKSRFEVVSPVTIEVSDDLRSFVEAVRGGAQATHPLKLGAEIKGLVNLE